MSDEELQVLREKYELSIIKFNQAKKMAAESKEKIAAAEVFYKDAIDVFKKSQDDVINNRKEYESAIYTFYEEYNE